MSKQGNGGLIKALRSTISFRRRKKLNKFGWKNQARWFSGVAIMLTITIFATIVSDMLPVSNNTPLIGGIATITITITIKTKITHPHTLNFQHLFYFLRVRTYFSKRINAIFQNIEEQTNTWHCYNNNNNNTPLIGGFARITITHHLYAELSTSLLLFRI